MRLRTSIQLTIAIFICFLLPTTAGAVYGCGTYGAGSYGNDCPASTTTPTTTAPDDASVVTIFANDQELLPDAQFTIGQPIVFSGTTTPYAEVHLYFQSDPFEAVVNADENGHWSYTLTRNLGEGEHSLQIAIVNPKTNVLGEKSAAITFELVAKKATGNTNTPKPEVQSDGFILYLTVLLLGLAIGISTVGIWWLMKKKRDSSKRA